MGEGSNANDPMKNEVDQRGAFKPNINYLMFYNILTLAPPVVFSLF